MSDTFLKPSLSTLCKLGSIVVHAEELLSSDGHHFDRSALQVLLDDPEVKAFITSGAKMAMFPLKRRMP